MSDAWFYLESIPEVGERCLLDVREARHATGSKRRQSGDHITCFDGCGVHAEAFIVDIAKNGRDVTAEIHRRHRAPAPQPSLHLLSALPKGDRLSTMLNMATQVGMTAFTPLRCERSVATPSGSWRTRAKRIMIEACKQSRRAHLPNIHDPVAPHEIDLADDVQLLADASGRPLHGVCHGAVSQESSIGVIIGPEGGFTDDEREMMQARGAVVVNLGANVLRIETAAIAMLSYLMLVSAACNE